MAKCVLLMLLVVSYCSALKPLPPMTFLENHVPCLDQSFRYRKRPTAVVTVTSRLHIMSLHTLSSEAMDVTADVYLEQQWHDPRCAFRPLPGQGSSLQLYESQGGASRSHAGLANLWRPDTHVVNAKSAHRPETVTTIRSSGLVRTRTRLVAVIACPMDLRNFPLDRQMCSVVLQSSAHTNDELTYRWHNVSGLVFVQGLDFQDRMTPDIILIGFRFRRRLRTLLSRDYDQIILDVFFERPLGYFLSEVYMPASFIVVMSFSSFWLDRQAVPARVSLGVTTVLTITTLLSSSNINLPVTAYPKGIGVFLAGCFLFTFLALIEYSAASYLLRRRPRDDEAGQRTPKMSSSAESVEAGRGPNRQLVRRIRKMTTLSELRDPHGWKPSAVDLFSRVVFPLAFLLFHVVYWSVSFCSVPPLPDDALVLVRE